MMNTNWCDSEKTDGTDRISSLPDDVLTHILSFLSTREAVQTCILSIRWINTWAFVPDLKFDIMEFNLPKFFTREDMIEKFELLVKSVLEKRETSGVNKFQLWLDYEIHWPCTQAVADCIGDVVKLGPRECLVEMCSRQKLNLNTDLIFTCASLIDLRLDLSTEVHPFVAIEPNSVNLPCLKTLKLYGVSMSDDSLKKLLLGCPVLEELLLQNFEMDIIEICSNTLKKLELYSLHDIMKLHISAPNLLYLNIGLMDMGEIMSLNTPSLVDASIFIPGWYAQDKYITMGPKLMHNLSNVKSLRLELCSPKKKVQKKDFSSYPVFNNLKRLKLVCWCFYVFDLPPYFLHHSPKLEELTFTNIHGWVPEFLDEETTQEGPRDAFVQREFLKTVRIVGFKNDNGFVDQLINKLLAHVKIIGEIVIVQRDPFR